MSETPVRRIELTEHADGRWTANDPDAGLTALADSRSGALDKLDDLRAALDGDAGHEPTDEELRELGVDPDRAREEGGSLPDVLE